MLQIGACSVGGVGAVYPLILLNQACLLSCLHPFSCRYIVAASRVQYDHQMLYTPVKRESNHDNGLGRGPVYVQSGKWYDNLDSARKVIAKRISGDQKPPDIVVMGVNTDAVWAAEALIKAKKYTIFEK